MTDFKKDFPIFENHPNLVYLDNTATTQKPAYVIDGVAEYLRTGYANIHRGSYELSEISEKLYEDSKKIVTKHIGAESWREIIYTSNSTYALNLLAQSIWRTGLLKAGDTVLVSVVEHHANIVPWLILKEDYGINVEFVGVTENFDLDYNDFRDKLTSKVKIVALTHVSNTTGQIFDISNVASLLSVRYGKQKPLLIIDGSQSVPHFSIDVRKLGCDAMFFTGHKIFADSGIGVLWAREELLQTLKPIFSGGGAIGEVSKESFTHSTMLPDKFEPGTPNLNGAVSLLKAFEYLGSIGGYEVLEAREKELTAYTLEKFKNISALKLIGSTSIENRLGVFTFVVEGIHSFDISDYLAEHDICIRAGQHCAEPLMRELGYTHTCRMSLHLYNTKEDIDSFFEILKQAITELS
ncbi:aminotransferase class V-fold PLP-dependent enzyme [Candidatus Gracilibacteria bacterium]|nr:aminotransferase class V-fold PLP-dependent enzyme [Candidatus Gracilibacteria bacterium]